VAAIAIVAMAQNQVVHQNDHHGIRARSLLGTKVSLQGGTQAGTIEDFVVNDEGVIDYLIVANNGKLVTIPWDAAKFNWQSRTAVINVTPQVFQQVPTYTVDQYPNFYTPTYRTQIYKSWGLTPGQERRLERRLNR
jgi:hypothetical protein